MSLDMVRREVFGIGRLDLGDCCVRWIVVIE